LPESDRKKLIVREGFLMSQNTREQSKAKNSHLTCALDLSRDGIVAALVDERARIVTSRRAELPETGGKAVVQAVIKTLLETCAAAEREESEISAVGLCIPGVVDQNAGRVTSPGLRWDRLALREMIERGIEDSGVDVRRAALARRGRAEKMDSAIPLIAVTSEAIAGVVAETWCGTAEGKQHVVYVSLSRKIVAGIMVEGKIIQGIGGVAGAAGWFALSEGFREEYATRGCLEAEAAAAALVRRTIEEWAGHTDSPLSKVVSEDPAHLTPETIIRAARSGDSLALSVVTDVCGWIGRGVAELISIFNPEIVIIGGEMGVALRPFLNEVRREARLWAHPLAARQCRILSATLGRNTGLLGAARMARLNLAGNV
jgi:glucokinase